MEVFEEKIIEANPDRTISKNEDKKQRLFLK